MICEECNRVSPGDECLNPECALGPPLPDYTPRDGECNCGAAEQGHSPDCLIWNRPDRKEE